MTLPEYEPDHGSEMLGELLVVVIVLAVVIGGLTLF